MFIYTEVCVLVCVFENTCTILSKKDVFTTNSPCLLWSSLLLLRMVIIIGSISNHDVYALYAIRKIKEGSEH
jgi:hypothetical protein